MATTHRAHEFVRATVVGSLLLGTACGVSESQSDNGGSVVVSTQETAVSATTIGVTEPLQEPADLDAGKFVEVLRNLPPWQTMRLPAVPFKTYIVSSAGLAVGRVDGLGDVAQTSLTGADIGQPGLEGVLTRLDVLLRVEVDHGRSVRADELPRIVGVPISIWIGGLPPDWDARQSAILQQLQDALPVGADVAILFTGVEGDILRIVGNGEVPSLAALTFGVPGGVMNAAPGTDAVGLAPDGPVESIDQLAAIVEAALVPR